MCYSQIRNHLIHRYFEDPLQLLSNIKDDDRLAAYKVPKIDKNTKYLQLIHRQREQYVILNLHDMHSCYIYQRIESTLSC